MVEEKIESNELQSEQIEPVPSKLNSLAILSTLSGLVGLFLLSIILGPLAIITGFFSYSQIKHNPHQRGKQFAILGVMLGILDIISLIIGIYMIS